MIVARGLKVGEEEGEEEEEGEVGEGREIAALVGGGGDDVWGVDGLEGVQLWGRGGVRRAFSSSSPIVVVTRARVVFSTRIHGICWRGQPVPTSSLVQRRVRDLCESCPPLVSPKVMYIFPSSRCEFLCTRMRLFLD